MLGLNSCRQCSFLGSHLTRSSVRRCRARPGRGSTDFQLFPTTCLHNSSVGYPCFGEKTRSLNSNDPLHCRATRSVNAMSSSKSVLVPIADGCEEMEAVITIDVLVRAGATVTVASVDGATVTCSRGVKIQADKLVSDIQDEEFDLIAVPGGMPGAEHFRDCEVLVKMLKKQKDSGRLYASICASPAVVFEHHKIIQGEPATCHPSFQSRLTNQGNVLERVVQSGNLTTSQGPGTAFEFALVLVKELFGEEKMKEVAGPMCMYDTPLLG
uniref:4-methyl-5(B-hydroxyethyl)-thiazole monophosphate biosynthesis n=1 Tax=Tetraselmis sp. GSL018 TaxID=582737 RepID=A0A061RL21_9CHLO